MGPPGPVSGPAYLIPDTVGQIRGANLFHSFSFFNIGSGESATFTGPAVIDNVVSRVTGGSPSSIDGFLRSTIPSADLWFINPAGVVFGQDASLDVDGSFHVSTADYLRLGGGGRFDATNPGNSVLTSAPPEAFGFLGPNPAGIRINHATLEVPEGAILSLIAGNLAIDGSKLVAPAGRINLASVASAGDLRLTATDLDATSFSVMGDTTVSGSDSRVDASGAGGGSVHIRAARFVLDGGKVSADTLGSQDGLITTIRVDELEVRNGAQITTNTFGSGHGGDMQIDAERISLSGDGSPFITGIGALTTGTGDAGSISVTTGRLEVRDGAAIASSTFGSGDAGNMRIDAGEVFLSRDGSAFPTGLSTSGQLESSTGDAGTLTLHVAGRLEVRDGAAVASSAFGKGDGGNMLVEAGEIFLSRDDSPFITGIGSLAESTGDAGSVTIHAHRIEVRDGAAIATSTFDVGDAGNLWVEADEILLSRDGSSFDTAIAASAERGSIGNAGSLDIRAGRITVRDGALIATRTRGPGDAGDMRIEADEILLSGQGDHIFFDTSGFHLLFTGITTVAESDSTGNAGTITVIAGRLEVIGAVLLSATFGPGDGGDMDVTADSIFVSGGGFGSASGVAAAISTNTGIAGFGGKGNAGNLHIRAGEILLTGDGSKAAVGIASSAEFGSSGDAGLLELDVGRIEVRNGAEIRSSTAGPGSAGNILIRADDILLSGDGSERPTEIVASAREGSTGPAGSIEINVGALEIRDGASIASRTSGHGEAGDMNIIADEILLSGDGSVLPTGIAADAIGTNTGDAGSIHIRSGQVIVRDGAAIRAGTTGRGRGGTISIATGSLLLENGGRITANSEGSGLAGDIVINAGQRFESDGGVVSTEARGSDGGDITLTAEDMVLLVDSRITTSVGNGDGEGGNINIDPQFVILINSQIIANAFGGPGGDITIVADNFLASPDSRVEAISKQAGINGTVTIDSPDTDVSGSLAVLPGNYLDATALLGQRCGTESGASRSSLVMGSGGDLPPEPGGYLIAPADGQPPPDALTVDGPREIDGGPYRLDAQSVAALGPGCR